MITLNEDDIYRASTQYRLWSFAPAALTSLRATTNEQAIEGVKAAIANKQHENGNTGKEVDCLSVGEEQKLVAFYCTKAMQLADFCEFPTNVKATAVQYLKRFYLSNSPMTYHPKEIMPAALYLSTKTENHYTSLRSFASKLPKSTPEDVIAPEFLLTQGLRFAFDVRHPSRGLEGGYMELMALATDGEDADAKTQMQKIAPTKTFPRSIKGQQDLVARIQQGHDRTSKILKTSAILSDSYFHFTPAQIWMSAWLLVDEPLLKFYVDYRLSSMQDLKLKVMQTLSKCRQMLEASASADPSAGELEDLKRIDKKLYKCRNPDKIDLVSLNKAQKREGDEMNGLDERTVKKRKQEREKAEKEADDIFGPALG